MGILPLPVQVQQEVGDVILGNRCNRAVYNRLGMEAMDKRAASRFMRRLAQDRPSPTTELEYRNVYQLLVAVVLSAQATDKGVNSATGTLFSKIKDPAAMVKLGRSQLEHHIRTIGLFRTKARNVIALSQQLLDEHDGTVPRTREQLQALPGVGRKTANVVLNCAFGEPTMAVDTHIFRVSNRTGLAPGKTPLAVEQALLAVISKDLLLHAHHWLILHGRYTCVARKPKCSQCPVARICRYPEKTS